MGGINLELRSYKPFANKEIKIPGDQGLYLFDFQGMTPIITKFGYNLVFSFENGGSIILDDFYSSDTAGKTIFEIDDEKISAMDMLAKLNMPELMPGTGPQTAIASNNRFHEYADLKLLDGVDHLGALDFHSDWDYEYQNTGYKLALPSAEEYQVGISQPVSEGPVCTPDLYGPSAPFIPEPGDPFPVPSPKPAPLPKPEPDPEPVIPPYFPDMPGEDIDISDRPDYPERPDMPSEPEKLHISPIEANESGIANESFVKIELPEGYKIIVTLPPETMPLKS